MASARGRKEKGVPVERIAFVEAQKSECDPPFRDLEEGQCDLSTQGRTGECVGEGDERQPGVGSGPRWGRPQEDVKCIGRKLSPWQLTTSREQEAGTRSCFKQACNAVCQTLPAELTFQWGVREKEQMGKELIRTIPDEDREDYKVGM